METVHYLRALRRSWALILVVVVVVLAGGVLVYERTTRVYQASTRMIAASGDATETSGSSAVTSYAAAQALAFGQIASTPPAVADAAEAAGRPGAAPVVTAVANGDDPFLSITVEGTDPAEIRAIANAFPTSLPITVARLVGAPPLPVTLKVLSPAALPTSPVSPSPLRYLGLALAAGVVIGLAAAVAREFLNRTVRDTDELEELTGLTVLGTVPAELAKQRLPADTHPRSARTEAYRQIRTTLLNNDGRGVPRVLIVTSATSGEGKTSVATNLAIVFCGAGHRVALVDADLRRPQVASSFGLAGRQGLTDVLSGRVSLADAVVLRQDDRLGVLTSGPVPANPSEALGSTAMDEVLAALSHEYELVIVDTPPVLPVADALVLAPKVDGVVMVSRLDRVTRDKIRRAQAAISRVNGRVIGIVPNGSRTAGDRDYRYTYAVRPDEVGDVEIGLDAVEPPRREGGHRLRSVPVSSTTRDADAAAASGS